MAIPALLAKVGTSLRTTNVILQNLEAPDFKPGERQTVKAVKDAATEVVKRLDALGAGDAQAPVTGTILPTDNILDSSGWSIDRDRARLGTLKAADLPPGRFQEFEELRDRVDDLKNVIAVAARR